MTEPPKAEVIIAGHPIILEGFEFHPHREGIKWFKDELARAKEVWCLWIAAGTALNNKVLDIRSIKRVVLASPNEKVMIDKIAEGVSETSKRVIDSIESVTTSAKPKGIEVRWWEGLSCNIMVFGNPNDIDAWVMLDLVLPTLSDEQRPVVRIWKSRMPELYKNLLSVYNEIWDKSDKTLEIRPPTPDKEGSQT